MFGMLLYVKICSQVISLSSLSQYCKVDISKPILQVIKWRLIEVKRFAEVHKANKALRHYQSELFTLTLHCLPQYNSSID